MGSERPPRGLLLRLAVLLTAAGLCVHLFLETRRPDPAEPVGPGHAPPSRGGKQRSVGTGDRRGSSGHTARMDGGAQEPPPACCPPLHPHKKARRWHVDLEPWASDRRSLEDEATRFLKYITTPQVSCPSVGGDEDTPGGASGTWAVCLDPKYSLTHRLHSKHCRVYSFGLRSDDWSLERSLARGGCDVHCFDPSLRQSHLQKADMWFHRLSVDWRDPNPAITQRRHSNTQKLATILNNFGHRQVDVLKVDMESAEWKILENMILEGVVESVGQLLLELHLHWAGFEVPGDEPAVVRYWFSLLKELERAHFRLFHVHSDPAKPHLFLHKNILNASSAYTVGWVNTRWRT